MQEKAKHLGYLDGLRGLAAIFVVLHHVYLQVADRQAFTGLPHRLLSPLFFGRYSVDLFIVLSGFCLMLPIVKGDGRLRGGALQFFQRRAWRILPPYFLALLFSWALAALVVNQKTGTHWDISIPVTRRAVITHFLLLHDVLGQDFTINHAFWSIAVEWRIYFLFPLLLWSWRRIGGVASTALAVILSFLLFKVSHHYDPDGLTAYYIGLFTMGMLSASIALSPAPQSGNLKKLPWGAITAIATLAVLIVSKARIWHGNILPYYFQDAVLGIWAMSLLTMVAMTEKGWIYHFLSSKPLVWLGTFAYSIYLIHAPLLQVFWQYVFRPLQDRPLPMFLALTLVGVPLIIGMSYVFFLGCERPFLRRKTRVAESLVAKTALEPAP